MLNNYKSKGTMRGYNWGILILKSMGRQSVVTSVVLRSLAGIYVCAAHVTSMLVTYRGRICRSCIEKMASLQKLYKNPFTICIEGNIGSGKTTFLQQFHKFNNATILPEPMHLWRNIEGVNLLDLLYKEPKRYSFLFQSYAQVTRLELHTTSTPTPYKIMERSIFSTKCFLENMKRTNKIFNVEATILEKWYDWSIENANIKTDLIVYLRTTPEIVYQRMQARARKEEESVPLEYLRQIHEIHEDWLYRQTLFSLPAPVMVIDGNKSLEEMVPQFEKCKDWILKKEIDSVPDTRIVIQ
ncbi:PREDICTED: deoxynucleoside kinase-like isoform X2 [Dinoponera quadriceps]|uniref:Deoxynucleoside kinase-like isoform X2 n=1 Tax=Dinoponera quadriceps TaxID=609295 RepID=A0A6P3WR72_DINQU|nr:PREDICTED: deoxynucleoside kinase-like isoform X2 [Dinoponera quadriceps]